MKLKHAAILATGLIIVIGIIMIIPLFLRQSHQSLPKPQVMLSFNISEDADAVEWSQDLSAILKSYDLGASVFIMGKVAEQYPQCLTVFSEKVDIGSQTYNNVNLTEISDYSLKLQEIQQGKQAVDQAGNIVSKLFRAPFMVTDQDIYSLLSRSEILADFSYPEQYNVYVQGHFIKYEAAVYKYSQNSVDLVSKIQDTTRPQLVIFDNCDSITEIKNFLASLNMQKIDIINASDLTGQVLTVRGDPNGDR